MTSCTSMTILPRVLLSRFEQNRFRPYETLKPRDQGLPMARILVVEDDDITRDVLHRMLEQAGYEVEDATDGNTGLKAYVRQRHDLILTDIVMPDSEGLEMIRAIRRLDSSARIIAISGGYSGRADDYLTTARTLGATKILAKPFSAEVVLSAVAEVLAQQVG
jgi:CheY-like chemotaxis protein